MPRFRLSPARAAALALVLLVSAAAPCPAAERAARTAVSSVPAPVLDAFHDAYPKAEIKGMSSLSDGGKDCYEIASLDGGRYRSVIYRADGALVAVEEDVATAELPKEVTAAVEAKYPGAKVVKALRTTRGGGETFALRLVAGGRRLTAIFAADGTLQGARDTGGARR